MNHETLLQFWHKEGLDAYIPLNAFHANEAVHAMDTIDPANMVPFTPELEDLCFLYRQIRQRKSLTVLEFGVGYSTVVMAAAMKKNKEEYGREFTESDIRCLNPFSVFSLDADEHWIKTAQERIPEDLREFVHINHSEVFIGTFQDRICHYYRSLPDIIPDFIYLDAPGPSQIQGEINGLSFHGCVERTLNGADILLMEPNLTPGTMIVVDGRMNNVRFLMHNLQRDWSILVDEQGDRAVLELKEPPLGIHNRRKLIFQGLL